MWLGGCTDCDAAAAAAATADALDEGGDTSRERRLRGDRLDSSSPLLPS